MVLGRTMGRIAYIFLQCTYGFLQTLLGLVVFVMNRKNEHRFFGNCIDTRWDSLSGLSLGLFIFTPEGDGDYAARVRVHEYGHTFQSLLLGPFYLFVGIISVLWGILPVFQKMRETKNVPYTSCFTEKWASSLGEKHTGAKAIW